MLINNMLNHTNHGTAMETRLLAGLRRLRCFGDGPPPFEELGVSSAQLGMLEWLGEFSGSALKDIARGLGVSAPNVSVAVRKLEALGLVGRRADPDDRRALLFALTERGEKLLCRVREYRSSKAQALLCNLTIDEQGALVALLEKAMALEEGGRS